MKTLINMKTPKLFLVMILGSALFLTAGIQASAQTTWPNDPEAFDYNLAPGEVKKADLSPATMEQYGIGKNDKMPIPSVTIDNMTWLSSEKNSGVYNAPPRIVYNRVKAYETVAGVKVASDIGLRFKINRPGSFSMYPRFMYAEDGRAQKFIAVLVTKKNGAVTATKIFEETKSEDDMSTVSKEPKDARYFIRFDVTEDMLAGIDEAATIYLWHAANNPDNTGHMVSYFPPRWTVAK